MGCTLLHRHMHGTDAARQLRHVLGNTMKPSWSPARHPHAGHQWPAMNITKQPSSCSNLRTGSYMTEKRRSTCGLLHSCQRDHRSSGVPCFWRIPRAAQQAQCFAPMHDDTARPTWQDHSHPKTVLIIWSCSSPPVLLMLHTWCSWNADMLM